MPLPKFEHHDARHKPTLIEPARSQMTASSPRGTFSQAELTAERVITRCITRWGCRVGERSLLSCRCGRGWFGAVGNPAEQAEDTLAPFLAAEQHRPEQNHRDGERDDDVGG